MGKIIFMPGQPEKERVRKLAAIGLTDTEIAANFQIPVKRLQRRFRRDLELGEAEGKTQVLEKLFDMAITGVNTTATLFWMKARCGWRDTGNPPAAAQKWPPLIIKCEK